MQQFEDNLGAFLKQKAKQGAERQAKKQAEQKAERREWRAASGERREQNAERKKLHVVLLSLERSDLVGGPRGAETPLVKTMLTIVEGIN